VTIRPLTLSDVDAVAEADFAAFQDAALRRGTTANVRAVRDSRARLRWLLEVDPLGGFVAQDGDRLVGHGWAHVRGPIATVGPIAVEPSSQRRGVGRDLLAHCLQAAGSRVMQVRLVHESADLVALRCCLTAGFRIVAPMLELALDPATVVTMPTVPTGVTLRPAVEQDVRRIVARDARPFGTPRQQDVERLVRRGCGVVADRGAALAGYGLGWAGQVGSAAGDDPEIVLAVLATLTGLASLRTTPLRILVPGTDRALVDGLLGLGFVLARACQYLIRGGGTAPPLGYVPMGPELT
jgi:predicted N-acetyltransferase YhbS